MTVFTLRHRDFHDALVWLTEMNAPKVWKTYGNFRTIPIEDDNHIYYDSIHVFDLTLPDDIALMFKLVWSERIVNVVV